MAEFTAQEMIIAFTLGIICVAGIWHTKSKLRAKGGKLQVNI